MILSKKKRSFRAKFISAPDKYLFSLMERDGIAKQIASFPEVKAVYLMSGAYDLAVFVEDSSLQQVSRFVSERISTFDGVLSTATHFILKKYKIEGVLTEKEGADNRISVQA
jgi:DNA-binding Lrp family transcriptional regulator